jgi:hypothetical protein
LICREQATSTFVAISLIGAIRYAARSGWNTRYTENGRARSHRSAQPAPSALAERKSPARPRVDGAVERLIVQMAQENSGWGYDRISGALANLGHRVSGQTIGAILWSGRMNTLTLWDAPGFRFTCLVTFAFEHAFSSGVMIVIRSSTPYVSAKLRTSAQFLGAHAVGLLPGLLPGL